MIWWILLAVAIAVVCAVSWRAGRQKVELQQAALRPGLNDHQMEGQLRSDLNRTHDSGRLGGP